MNCNKRRKPQIKASPAMITAEMILLKHAERSQVLQMACRLAFDEADANRTEITTPTKDIMGE